MGKVTVKMLRAMKGWTQFEMAEKLEVCPATYGRKEIGDSPFRVREIDKILAIFNMKFEEIDWEAKKDG